MAKKKADNEKAAPMKYQSIRQPNLRHQLQRAARRSKDGSANVQEIVKNADQEKK